MIVVVSFVLLAPGLTIASLLRLPGLALNATVVILTGIATGVLIPSALLYAHLWSPLAAFAIVVAVTLALAAGAILDARHHAAEVALRDAPVRIKLGLDEERPSDRRWA